MRSPSKRCVVDCISPSSQDVVQSLNKFLTSLLILSLSRPEHYSPLSAGKSCRRGKKQNVNARRHRHDDARNVNAIPICMKISTFGF